MQGSSLPNGSWRTQTANSDPRSIPDLIGDVIGNAEALIRGEIRLAKAEIKEELTEAGKAAAMLAVGGVLAVLGLGFLLLAAVYGLSLIMPSWAAALIVGVTVGVIGGILVMIGRNRLQRLTPAPEQTIQSIKEDVAWVRQQTR